MKVFIPKIFFYFILCGSIRFFISSCNENNKNQTRSAKENAAPQNQIIKKPGSSFSDTIVIQSNAAVFYSPDSLQMIKIKAVNTKDIYDMLVHDCHYQMQNARTELGRHWPQIKVVDVVRARYLLFIKADKSRICIDLNDKNDICGLFLFNTKKDPILADMPNIDTILNYYFGR